MQHGILSNINFIFPRMQLFFVCLEYRKAEDFHLILTVLALPRNLNGLEYKDQFSNGILELNEVEPHEYCD